MRRDHAISLVAILGVAIIWLGATVASGHSPRLGLDLQGGTAVVLQPEPGTKVKPGALSQAKDIIDRRVNALGVAEPDIELQGNSIIVQLPGVKDPEKAQRVIGTTAQLYFRPVLGQVNIKAGTCSNPQSGAATPTTTTTAPGVTTTTAPAATSTTAHAAGASTATPSLQLISFATATTIPPTTAAPPTTTAAGPTTTVPAAPQEVEASKVDDPTQTVFLCDAKTGAGYALGPVDPPDLNGTAISGANATINPTTGQWSVQFTMNDRGAKLFDQMASKNYQKQVAIDLDGRVQSAPTFQTTTFNGKGEISGSFTQKEAKELALVLRYGSLPVKLVPVTQQNVSATLGKDSLHAGLIAGAVGLALVALYMLFYYRALGLVVVLGIMVSGALMYSIVTALSTSGNLALSLSGAIGIIVSVGVTVDSYVVYFERLKDEIRSGKTIRSSVDRGFTRAYRTIVAADVVSLIGAALLYYLSVGSVRGFAFFLGVSTALDLVTAYTFTRPMVVLLGRNRFFTEARFFGVARGLAAAEPGGAA
ncbi:MAG: protein-export rane protein SecD/SecF family [Acidimicrobiales bacterium]|nr:protein-export rane protein SecD/SecF family [Acidimicrobiales bacterium]